MLRQSVDVPAAIFLLADHLDAVLAAGEDLRKLRLAIPPAKAGLTADTARDVRQFVESVQALELTVIMRTLEAQKRVRDLRQAEKVLSLILGLFTGGTAALADGAAECGDPSAAEFGSAGDPLNYLRTRGLLEDTNGSLLGCVRLEVSEEMLIASRIPLGVIMDHAAAVMDALENYYDIYSPAGDETELAPVKRGDTLLTPSVPLV